MGPPGHAHPVRPLLQAQGATTPVGVLQRHVRFFSSHFVTRMLCRNGESERRFVRSFVYVVKMAIVKLIDPRVVVRV